MKFRIQTARHLALPLLLETSLSCADEPNASGWKVTDTNADQSTYGSDNDVVISATGDSYVVASDPTTDSGCIDLGDGRHCVDISDAKGRYCNDERAQADIIVGADSEVIEVVCYPPSEDGTPVKELQPDAEGNIVLPQNQNGKVIIFPESSDGSILKGDLNVSGERTTLYGNGVNQTIIDGDLTVDSNNARVRGMTIRGDVNYTGNNATLVLCRITGNLNVKSNGFTVADCEVFGDVTVNGNSAVLVNVGVQGEWNVNAGATCEGCYMFADANQDGRVDDDEKTGPIQCGPKN